MKNTAVLLVTVAGLALVAAIRIGWAETDDRNASVQLAGDVRNGNESSVDVAIADQVLAEPTSDLARDVVDDDETDRGVPPPALVDELAEKMTVNVDVGTWSTILAESERDRAMIARLRAELDECRNGTFSAIGNARALPEWPKLDQAQQAGVLAFLEQFPVQLVAGEAQLIATHEAPGRDRLADVIGILGRRRVLGAMAPDQRVRMFNDDSDRFRDYFGAETP